jgi:hypothetical protein
MKNFNSRFDRAFKFSGALFICVWFGVVLANLALVGGVVYVAWHFISEYW